MPAARTSLLRLVAGLILAALAVLAASGPAEACAPVPGPRHEASPLTVERAIQAGDHGGALIREAGQRGDPALAEALHHSCHHGAAGLLPPASPGPVPPGPAAEALPLAELLRPGLPPEGLRRPPRHL